MVLLVLGGLVVLALGLTAGTRPDAGRGTDTDAASPTGDPPADRMPDGAADDADRDHAAPGADADDDGDGGAVDEAGRDSSSDAAERGGASDGATEDGADGRDGEPGRLVLHHVGDVNLDPGSVPILAEGDYAGAWDGVRDVFAEADLVLANLECTASEGGIPQDKQFRFRCDLAALPAMRDAGVDVVTLANNHSGDFGIEAMVESVGNVEDAGLVAVGVGRDEEEAYRPRIVEASGLRVAVLGFGGVVPVPEWHARGDRPGQATGYDAERMAQAVAAARREADLVVATVHWGREGADEPRREDVAKARAMVEAGVDAVFGHHAHRLQPVELVDGVPVFWGLGNFVWPRTSAAGATTAIAEWTREPDGSGRACLRHAEIDARGVPAPTGAAPTCVDVRPRAAH